MREKHPNFVDVVDHCSLTGAMLLKTRIEAYWLAQGLEGIKIDVFSVEGTNLYSLRSNIADLLTVSASNVYSTGDE